MKKSLICGFMALSLTACDKGVQAPVAKQIPHVMKEFGSTRIDPYFWIRLSDDQKNAVRPDQQTQDVLDYIQAENAYSEHYFAPLNAVQDSLYTEMKSRMAPDDASVPYKKNGYTYITRYEEGKDYPIFTRVAENSNQEQLLLDVNVLAEGQKYCGVSHVEVSPDNKLVAFGTDFVSRRIYTIVIKDLETGEMLRDTLRESGGGVAWAADSRHLYYVGRDVPTLRNNRVYRHTLGQPQSSDELLWDETDETFSVSIGTSIDEKYIIANSNQTLKYFPNKYFFYLSQKACALAYAFCYIV